MDDATWQRAEVREWLERRALAVQIDIAADREVARGLNVRAVPTTIVCRAGKQEERMVGFQSAVEISAWFSSLEKRQTRPDGHLRDSSASMALADKRYDEATKGYVWLWNNIPGLDDTYEYGWMGVRQSFMLKPLGSLVNCHPPAHEAFSSLRDASGSAAPPFDLTDWFGPRVDWLLLNRLLGQEDRTLEWFDSIKVDPRRLRDGRHRRRRVRAVGPAAARRRRNHPAAEGQRDRRIGSAPGTSIRSGPRCHRLQSMMQSTAGENLVEDTRARRA